MARYQGRSGRLAITGMDGKNHTFEVSRFYMDNPKPVEGNPASEDKVIRGPKDQWLECTVKWTDNVDAKIFFYLVTDAPVILANYQRAQERREGIYLYSNEFTGGWSGRLV